MAIKFGEDGPAQIRRLKKIPPGKVIAVVKELPDDPPPLTGLKVRMVGVRMTEDEIERIDAARGSVSRQDFLRKAGLWLADQAEKLK